MKVYFETKREAMYRNIKYWGKKPHNIWNELIEENTNIGDIVFDPFIGSNVTFFESIILDRVPLGVDINPLSSFIVDVYSENYDESYIDEIYEHLKSVIERDIHYKHYFKNASCQFCQENNNISNYIWENNIRTEYRFKCTNCSKDNLIEIEETKQFKVPHPKWVPYFDLRGLSLIRNNNIDKFGGHNISHLYTESNLYINVILFDEIQKLNEPYRKLFILIFLQMVHLTTKMCAVRNAASGRLYSSSWGRPAYLALRKFMEQNPLIQLERSIYGNSGIKNALKSVRERIPPFEFDKYTLDNINISKSQGIDKATVIKGDSKNRVVNNNTIDFIITDPPYGDIIQYGELSLVWNTWLRIAYNEYSIDLNEEIIVNDKSNYEQYFDNLLQVFNNCYLQLKPFKKMIFTFNSNKQDDWAILVNLLTETEFTIESFYLQKNMRSSEANVKSKNGMAVSDYYIVLVKDIKIKNEDRLKNNIIQIKKLKKMWRNDTNGKIR